MDVKRILGWLFIPFVMVFIDWKRAHVALKIYGVFSASVFAIMIIAAIASDEPVETKEQTKVQSQEVKVVKETPLYPEDVLDMVEKLKEPGMSKIDKYAMFEQKLIGLKPTEKEMEKHKKIILDAYQILTFEGINKLTDETLLKQIYSARIVDRYYSFDEVANPTGLFAFNYLQIAKDAYRKILEQENYDINKRTMDKHYNNM